MQIKPELIFYSGSTLLEGPSWDPLEKKLTCVSIEQGLIYRINIESGSVHSIPTIGAVGCTVKKGLDIYWSAEKTGIYEINIKTGNRKFLVHPESNPSFRYNDGILDPLGRFIFGNMGNNEDLIGKGKLFSYDGKQCKVLIENITISNGIAFSLDGSIMYYIDTPTRKVAKYNYNLETGDVNFDKYVIEFVGDGLPDGMCRDNQGMLWIAEWNGGKVSKWNPNTGEKLIEISLPCKNVTSCCLGGENEDYLYITTAKSEIGDEFLAGGLFKVKIN
jgi:sugar lactone lactonase YvrE